MKINLDEKISTQNISVHESFRAEEEMRNKF